MNTLVRDAPLAVLRGISQVFLQRNALTGLVVLVALAVASPRLALLALVGSSTQSGLAVLNHHRDEARDGLMGYNGALVGAAAALDVARLPLAIGVTMLGAAACIAVHEFFRWLLALPPLSRLALPIATAPFCLVASVQHLVLVHGGMRTGPVERPLGGQVALPAVLQGSLNSLAEVFLADGWLAGLLVLIALGIASRRVGPWALLGAVLATGIAWLCDLDRGAAVAGLDGYSAVLLAIAVGATFREHHSLTWRLGVTVVGVLLTMVVRLGLAATAVPVYTWPFVVGLWVVLAVTAQPSGRP